MFKKILILSLFLANTVFGQGVVESKVTLSEGSTGFAIMDFYDELGNLVRPDYVAFNVQSRDGTVMQSTQVCEEGGSCSSFFAGASTTDENMILILAPRSQKILLGNKFTPEGRSLFIWFRYPVDCIDGNSGGQGCKYGSGYESYSVMNIPGVCVDEDAESGYGAPQAEPCS